jgi:WD40 repeat protein
MGRFFITLLLAVGIAAGVAYYYEVPPFDRDKGSGGTAPAHEEQAPRVELGNVLYIVKGPALAPIVDRADPTIDQLQIQPIVVSDCHLVPIDKQDAASAKDGILLIIGRKVDQEPPDGSPLPIVSIWQEGKKHEYAYERLKEGAFVEYDQVVALIDPTTALNEVANKLAKIEFAKAEYKAAIAMAKEAQARLDRLDDLKRRDPRVVSAEEYSAAVLTRDKHAFEEVSKKEQVNVQIIEWHNAVAEYHKYEIRCTMPGKSIVKQLYKNRGDGVKNLEPVMQLQNISTLRAEGAVEAQYFYLLASRVKKARVVIEPAEEIAPQAALKAHLGEINSVAVAADDNTFVSGSEDRTICVWRRGRVGPAAVLAVLPHSSPVRVVACTPPGAKQNLCAAGLADGRIVLWDLNQVGKPGVRPQPLLEIRDAHRDGISALAFSPDGRWFASGGQDNLIVLWETGKDKAVYPFDAEHGVENPHQGTVTALHFTPDGKLVSAGRDNTLRVWQLHEKGAALEGDPVTGRSGTVAIPGVTGTADDQFMVYDRGRTLQLLSVKDKEHRTMAVLNNSSAATQFETFVLFSPDGALMLTAGAPEGRMQLWRTPGRYEFKRGDKTEVRDLRGFEVRQLVPSERGAVTCAAFAPGGQFAVSGTKDGYVHFWKLPTRQQVAEHRISTQRDPLKKAGDAGAETPLTLTYLDQALDAGKLRIGVEVQNPETPEYHHGRLIPGRRVTVVIEP